MASDDGPERDRLAAWTFPVAVLALLVWSISLAWLPMAGQDPGWVLPTVRLAEILAVALAIVAVWLGTLAARADRSTTSSERGMRLAVIVVVLVIGSNLLDQALFR